MLNSKALDSIPECGILIYDQNVDLIKIIWYSTKYSIRCADTMR
jgi:hypothetical protein